MGNSAPGTYIASARIGNVGFSPGAGKSFMATQGKRMFIWDIEGSKSVMDQEITGGIITHASWAPFDKNLLAVSCMTGTISVLDTRISSKTRTGVVYKVADAHSSAVSCAKFSPFIPYWLASAGQDGVVKLWDLVFTCVLIVAEI
jgi:WD40 repeat protein